jgi:predicted nucleotidyltransferase component of viral defense system
LKFPRPDPVAVSVHDRLLKLAISRKEDFNAILARYGVERLLYRLTRTPHVSRFILKGAAMFVLWLGRVHRPTRDLDLLGSGQIDSDILRAIFADVATVSVEPDGLAFDPNTITVSEIRKGQQYQGLRVKVHGKLGTARLTVQVDVGLGDAITPRPEIAEYPTLLKMPAPRLRVYPQETTIAEKLDAMLELGLKNSRMKDYYDICTLCLNFAFNGEVLCEAIRATLTRRARMIPSELPTGLTDDFAASPGKAQQWTAFLRTHRSPDVPADLPSVVRKVRDFLAPPLQSVSTGAPFKAQWLVGGPWQAKPKPKSSMTLPA